MTVAELSVDQKFSSASLHPALGAEKTHFRFASVNLSFDGNERTGRLLLNWQRLRSGFPLTVLQVEERARIWTRWIAATVQGAPLFTETDLPALRAITGAYGNSDHASLERLMASIAELDATRDKDLALLGYAGMIVALWHPEAFEHRLMPRFQASGDPGLQFLCAQFLELQLNAA